MKEIPVLTIDGPSGVGKGTISLKMAQRLDWHYLDSGALYRIVGYGSGQKGIAQDDVAALAAYAESLDVQFEVEPGAELAHVILENQKLDQELRSEEAGNMASIVAAIPEVRTALLARQRAFRQLPGLVADGRDMGTVVFADAPIKVYLTASAEERAERRYKQLKEKGIEATLAGLAEAIRERDARDSSRQTAPLKPASDAHIIDTTELSIDEVEQAVVELCKPYIS